MVFSELCFCSGDDALYLFVGVVIVVVMGDIVLDKMAELPEFLAVIGGLRGKHAVFPFGGFGEVIVNTLLPGDFPDQQQKYHR